MMMNIEFLGKDLFKQLLIHPKLIHPKAKTESLKNNLSYFKIDEN